LIRVHLTITGKVQGVGYRNNAKRRADLLGIRGWVKNLSDGNVEIVAQGSERGVEEFITWCQKGALFAKVENVAVEREELAGDFWDFKIIR
jgi:acylphosphatase